MVPWSTHSPAEDRDKHLHWRSHRFQISMKQSESSAYVGKGNIICWGEQGLWSHHLFFKTSLKWLSKLISIGSIMLWFRTLLYSGDQIPTLLQTSCGSGICHLSHNWHGKLTVPGSSILKYATLLCMGCLLNQKHYSPICVALQEHIYMCN